MGSYTDEWWTGTGKTPDEAILAAHARRMTDDPIPSWYLDDLDRIDYRLEMRVSVILSSGKDVSLEYEAILRKS